MRQLAAYGVAIGVRTGWECRILRRSPAPVAATAGAGAASEQTRTVVHLANFPLPEQRDDFGGGVTASMSAADVLVVLFEYGPESLGQPLFASQGVPRVTPSMFGPKRLQRPLPGQVGCQLFFTANNRPFCLYVVAGSATFLPQVASEVNLGLDNLEIQA